MAEYVKSFIGYLLIIILVFAGVSLISVSIDAANAQRYVSDLTDAMEADNFSDQVIADCLSKVNGQTAAATNPQVKHYSNLEIKALRNGSDPYSSGYEITMDYEFSIPLLNVVGTKHSIRTYAR